MNKVFTFVLFKKESYGENLGNGAFFSMMRKDGHKLMEKTLLML